MVEEKEKQTENNENQTDMKAEPSTEQTVSYEDSDIQQRLDLTQLEQRVTSLEQRLMSVENPTQPDPKSNEEVPASGESEDDSSSDNSGEDADSNSSGNTLDEIERILNI